MTQVAGTLPIEQTFRFLVHDARPAAGGLIAYAVLHSTGDARRVAISAALDMTERAPLEAIIRAFDTIPADFQATAIARADAFLPILRQNVHDSDHAIRSNACDFLRRMDDTRVAYLFADLLQDASEDIATKAQEGLISLAKGYHALVTDAVKGGSGASKQTLETKRYALLDALLTALRFYRTHERPEIVAALLSLDPRSDEVLIDILANTLDRRRKTILDVLSEASHQRVTSFVLAMLKNPRTASLAVEILEKRSETQFAYSLMQTTGLMTNTRVGSGLAQVRSVPWLKAGSEAPSRLPSRLAVRAVRYLLLTGSTFDEKRVVLESLGRSGNAAMAAAAKFALSALAQQARQDKIDAALLKMEERFPEPGSSEKLGGDAVGPRGAGKARATMVLPDEALFHNFVDSFEALGRTERDSSVSVFVSKGIFLRELRKMLSDADADAVLRAVKVVEWCKSQADLSVEMSLLTKHPDARVRSAVVRQLGKAGAYEAVKALFDTLADRDRRVLANAVEGLEATGFRQVLRYLEPLLKHPDNRVRANAAKAAWTLGDEGGRDVLVEMLRNPKPDMRLSALWALRQIGAKDEAATIRAMAEGDSDERVRKSAQLALAELEGVT